MKDFHIHTTFSDGKNTPEEMIKAAIDMGLSDIGFTDHSYTSFDTSYCMPAEKREEYFEEINMLKKKYRGRINVLCGIEQDYYADFSSEPYDYVIGGVHYVFIGGKYIPVDSDPEELEKDVKEYAGGDFLTVCEKYFETVSDVVQKTGADIIGHFDLICKFNEKNGFFDENDPRYVAAWKSAADKLLQYNIPFEINTGPISRGYKTVPYPNSEMLRYIREKGGKFILSSDSHKKEGICFKFDEYEDYIR